MGCLRLPRACGTIIKCDRDGCPEVSQTGQMFGHLHMTYLATRGWLVRPGALERHLCPQHGAEVAAAIKASKERAAAAKVKREANRRERVRRQKLTPEQRKAEDKQQAAARRAAKQEKQIEAA